MKQHFHFNNYRVHCNNLTVGGIEDDTSHLDQKSPTEDWDRGIQEEVKTSESEQDCCFITSEWVGVCVKCQHSNFSAIS